MSEYLSAKMLMLQLLTEQKDQVKQRRTLKLNQLALSHPKLSMSEVIECVHEFLYSFQPPLELERLSLQGNNLESLPLNFAIIANNIKYLDLQNNKLADLPRSVTRATGLEILDLSKNRISYLPKQELLKLTSLRVLSLKENNLTVLPPALGELPLLHLIEVADNPLQYPPMDVIRVYQKHSTDLEWVLELKSYLVANAAMLEAKLKEVEPKPILQNAPPAISRSKSISETRTKASKAARRMGLIIRKPDAGPEDREHSNETTDTLFDSDLSSLSLPFPTADSFPLKTSPVPATTTATTAMPKTSVSSTSSPSTTPRPGSRGRSRSNTLKEIDIILEKNETVDTEHKSGAYFRRLSTLQELPADELALKNFHSASLSGPSRTYRESTDPQKKAEAVNETNEQSSIPKIDTSLARKDFKTEMPTYNVSAMIKVSRKVLFSFSELHSSVRRFTGFCVDKKVTMKMVTHLFTAKANIDTLVEDLETVEETGNSNELIVRSLRSSISSIKAMMSLLSDNFPLFVAKIDVCFVRMLYLTLFGSFNELLNAYRLVPSSPKIAASTETRPKQLTINTTLANELDEVDGQLYNSIEHATANAQTVFGELTRAMSKSAIASAQNPSGVGFNPTLTAKVKDLTNVCVASMDITKKLKTKLITIRNNPSQTTKKLFWVDINLFLKMIIQTFSSVKGIMREMPILNDIRSSMATLTKATKDVTVLLEASSYKLMSQEGNVLSSSHPPLQSMPSVSNIFTPLTAHPSLTGHSLSQVNLVQAGQNAASTRAIGATLGTASQSMIPPAANHEVTTSSPLASPGAITGGASMTAPANSSGLYYARIGMNPFDGLIMATRRENEQMESERRDSDRDK